MLTEDNYDKAIRWALEQPHLQKLMYNCYKTYDTCNDARRFYKSEDFSY